MKQITDFELMETVDYGKSVWQRYRSSVPLPLIEAGQFVQVRVDDSPSTYLRRPISIHDVEPSKNEISLLVQKAGEGTQHIAALPVGATVNMVLPLGNSFTLPQSDREQVLLVGGGIGIAPLYYWGKVLKSNGITIQFLLGGKSKSDLIRRETYEKIAPVACTTEDGSWGEKGFVTQHSIWQQTRFDRIYVCGPKPMMKAVAALCKEKDLWCEVSLENLMACGLGACLCCVENTTEGHLCVCKEGPIFNIRRLLW